MKNIKAVFEAAEQFLGRKLTKDDEADLRQVLAQMDASVPPPTEPPDKPKP